MKITTTIRAIFIMLFASNTFLLLAQQDSIILEDESGQTSFLMPFYESSLGNTTAPVQIIKGKGLESYPGTDVTLSLTGRIANGVITERYNPLESRSGMQFRGSNYLVLVDGVPRPLSDLSAFEIESINVIKGLSGTAMFGSDALEGILYVETKKGISGKKEISLEVDQGISFVQKNYLPRWANSYEYASLYNEASINDGLPEPYSAEDLQGYQSGESPLRYPDENLYDQIFNSRMNYSRVNLFFRGGDNSTRYFINLAYQNEGEGLYKMGKFGTDDLKLRTNLDVDLSDVIHLNVGAMGSVNLAEYSNAESEVWSILSSYPPNAYPVEIATDTFGTNPAYPINPVGDLTEYLSSQDINRTGRFNIKLDVDLSSLLPGLKMDNLLSYDMVTRSTLRERPNKTYPLFQPVFIDDDGIPDSLIQYGLSDPSAGVSIANDYYSAQFYQYSQLAYNRQFGNHAIDAGIVNSFKYYSYRLNNSFEQDIKKQDLSFKFSYSYNNKYNLDFIGSYTGIMNLPADKRFQAYPTVGVSWLVSEESFLKSSELVNYLKLRASYGKMGVFNSSELFIHTTYWDQSGWTVFNNRTETADGRFRGTIREQIGNEEITWGELTETNIGTDISILANKLSVSFDYFTRTSEGLVDNYQIPSIVGLTSYQANIGSIEKVGFDASLFIRLMDKKDFDLNLNFNLGHYVSTVLVNNELDVPFEWMSRINRPTDAIFGLEANGLIDDDETTEEPIALFGKVNPGNIQYTDLNDDGVIQDEIDEKMIGNNTPRYNYGLYISMRYKQTSLKINGYGRSGYNINTLNNPYFYAYGNSKYSEYTLDNRWTAEQPDVDASHPRLTTTSNSNDRRASTYWLMDGGYFRIKSAELAYTFEDVRGGTNQIRIFARGTNLFTFSKIKDLDPENLNLGVTTYPSMQTFSLGLSLTFN